MSNANGLSPFRGKVDQFIIPVGYFKGNYPVASKHQKIVVEEPSPKYVLTKIDQVQRTTPQEENAEVFYSNKIKIEKADLGNGVSSLSLSSIALKKEAERKSFSKKNKVKDAEENFTQETILALIKVYAKEKSGLGENNIAALLEMSQPEILADHKILLKTTNLISKVELKKEIPTLLSHLCERLNNNKISFEIKVEPQKSEEFAYGTKDKFKHLKKINPEIELLIKEFNLDL